MLKLPLLLLEDELLGLLMLLLLLLEDELLGLLMLLLLLEDELLGLTYSELERTCLLLLAGAYDLRSDEDDEDFIVELFDGRELLDGLMAELLEGRDALDGRVMLEGLSLSLETLEGLDVEDGANPSETGLLVVPVTCKPPC